MKKDAHFYATLAFCRACGFKKEIAHTVAYASQYVDDARINLIFFEKTNQEFPHDTVNQRPAFFNMATTHAYFRIKTFNYEAMVNNTSAFHFVPGCKGENFSKKLRCMEESPIILEILSDTLNEEDLIKLGIVLHAYVDTFSHQGFSGLLSRVNNIKNCQPTIKVHTDPLGKIMDFIKQFREEKYEILLNSILPAYGHAQAMDFPDLPYLTWCYEYDYSDEFNGTYKKVEIDNRDRYTRAFAGMKKYVQTFLQNHPQYMDPLLEFKNFDELFKALLFEAHDQKRIKNWQHALVKLGLFSPADRALLTYDEEQWLKEAFRNYDRKAFDRRRVEGAQIAEYFAHSHWYRFYQATKWYKQKFFQYCSKYQLNIPQ